MPVSTPWLRIAKTIPSGTLVSEWARRRMDAFPGRMSFEIEVMEQPAVASKLHVLVKLHGVKVHGCFDRMHRFARAVFLNVLIEYC